MPSSWVAVGGGREGKTVESGGWTTKTWNEPNPVAMYLVPFAGMSRTTSGLRWWCTKTLTSGTAMWCRLSSGGTSASTSASLPICPGCGQKRKKASRSTSTTAKPSRRSGMTTRCGETCSTTCARAVRNAQRMRCSTRWGSTAKGRWLCMRCGAPSGIRRFWRSCVPGRPRTSGATRPGRSSRRMCRR
ncbi:putative metallopeptidase [Mycobacteroides abscessus subsp. abscessus]|nr:putative metallopeptidase [Mycobacteroides abscessus subsp. abscessus]